MSGVADGGVTHCGTTGCRYGSCLDTGACFCQAGWFGRVCDMGQQACNALVCHGRGVCTMMSPGGPGGGGGELALRCTCDVRCGYVGVACTTCPTQTRCLDVCPYVDTVVPGTSLAGGGGGGGDGAPVAFVLLALGSTVFFGVFAVVAVRKFLQYRRERAALVQAQLAAGRGPGKDGGGGGDGFDGVLSTGCPPGRGRRRRSRGRLHSAAVKRKVSFADNESAAAAAAAAEAEGADTPSLPPLPPMLPGLAPRRAVSELERLPDGQWSRRRTSSGALAPAAASGMLSAAGGGGTAGEFDAGSASLRTVPSQTYSESVALTTDNPMLQYAEDEQQDGDGFDGSGLDDPEYSERSEGGLCEGGGGEGGSGDDDDDDEGSAVVELVFD